MHAVNSPQNKASARFALSRKEAMIRDMADDLTRLGALGSDRDAVRALTGHYPLVDIMMLAGEARMVAFQEVVAREMGKP